MESLFFAINTVAPIMLTVMIGYVLKKMHFIDQSFAKMANRLVFHVFLPAMLFLNIYNIDDITETDFRFVFYALAMLITVFLVSIPLVTMLTKEPSRRGVLLQATFRSNYALIGIPLAESLFGKAGVEIATLLSAVFIPMLNILAVISLSMFGSNGKKPSVKKILLDILKNPLIESIALGLFVVALRYIFISRGISFRLSDITPIYTVLGYLKNLATPIALLMLGAQFEFSAISSLKKEIIFGTLMRTAFVPALCIGVAYFVFGNIFEGAHFAAFVAAFATPVAVSSVPMSQEMGGDVTLAGQLVVWTTLSSVASVFIVSFLLKLAGVF